MRLGAPHAASASELTDDGRNHQNMNDMRATAKQMVKEFLPDQLSVAIQSILSRNFQVRQMKGTPGYLETLTSLTEKYGYSVLHGPFQGLTYPRRSLLSRAGIPRLLGTYESELHPIIRSITPGQYDRIIDIGSAEGYYAVGLARQTGAVVYAFDTEYRERAFCREMARLNGVSPKVKISSWCNQEVLKRVVSGRCLIMCDCEGYETELFTGEVIDRLRDTDLIVELHEPNADYTARTTEQSLLKRFMGSHGSELLTFSKGTYDPAFVRELSILGSGPERFVRENRAAGQRWVYLKALASRS
jgi:hypothetical protein